MPKNDAPRVGDDGKPLPHSMDGRFWAEEYCRMRGGDLDWYAAIVASQTSPPVKRRWWQRLWGFVTKDAR